MNDVTVTPDRLWDCSEKWSENHILGTGPRSPTQRGDNSSRAEDELQPSAAELAEEGRNHRRRARGQERDRGSGTAGGETSQQRLTQA